MAVRSRSSTTARMADRRGDQPQREMSIGLRPEGEGAHAAAIDEAAESCPVAIIHIESRLRLCARRTLFQGGRPVAVVPQRPLAGPRRATTWTLEAVS